MIIKNWFNEDYEDYAFLQWRKQKKNKHDWFFKSSEI